MSEPKSPQMKPYVKDEEPGKRAWCACGLSANQPYCDGSHKNTDFKPVITEIKEAGKVAWCGCKRSGNKPFCDGTHSKL
ncbi:MAG: CDGSH iron-sulfur domain-containing protein [Deltaproteobacteria bacterium]|nr:CDGSH iron-sulfur domain-containing protein [Deltaproteobacteria bacterium]